MFHSSNKWFSELTSLVFILTWYSVEQEQFEIKQASLILMVLHFLLKYSALKMQQSY